MNFTRGEMFLAIQNTLVIQFKADHNGYTPNDEQKAELSARAKECLDYAEEIVKFVRGVK